MGRTVAELRAGMSAREMDRWRLYWMERPWGAWRDNVHAALIASVIANVNRGKTSKPFTVADFMLASPTERQQRIAAASAAFLEMFRSMARQKRKAVKKSQERLQ